MRRTPVIDAPTLPAAADHPASGLDASGRLSAFEALAEGSPFQCAAFVRAWEAHRAPAAGTSVVVLTLRGEDGVSALLPLEIVRRGPFRIGRFPGGTHANSNGPLRRRDGRPALSAASVTDVLRKTSLGIDALDLRRVDDVAFLGTATARRAAEDRFAVSLEGGLEAVLARGNGKRKRKKFRAQQRHFAGKGGYAFLDVPASRRPAVLETFLGQKRERFRDAGLPNPFAQQGIAAFLRQLFTDPGADSRLYAIEAGGTQKAMIGGLVRQGTFWGMFSSFADDEDAEISPGELLLWHLVETLSAEGIAVLDLGPGEERYKRSWCDRIVPQYDALVPLNRRGAVYASAARLTQAAAAAVKGDARLRRTAQWLRRVVGPR